jgi:hypothetical protein
LDADTCKDHEVVLSGCITCQIGAALGDPAQTRGYACAWCQTIRTVRDLSRSACPEVPAMARMARFALSADTRRLQAT